MPRIPDTSNRQTSFLRALRSGPDGLARAVWPSAVVLRRWMRRPGFRAALASLSGALSARADFELLMASARAAEGLRRAVDPDATTTNAAPTDPVQVDRLIKMMRLVHLRQRFGLGGSSRPSPFDPAPAPAAKPEPEIPVFDSRSWESTLWTLRRMKPDRPIAEAIHCIECWAVHKQPDDRSVLLDP
jgi:hypothetical protein